MSRTKNNQEKVPLPEGFLEEMEALLGPLETSRLAETLDGDPPVSIRFNRRKTRGLKDIASLLPAGAQPVEWCPSGFYLPERPDFIRDPLLHAGVYYVQEAASMVYEGIINDLILEMGKRSQGTLSILDLCAAPGGKSTAILNGVASAAEKGVETDYFLVANEIDRKRVKALKENLDKWGDPNVIVTNSTSTRFAAIGEVFDIVAVDAPCSGEGMMRREPIARRQWSQQLVRQCSTIQREILSNAVAALKPGGYLIYSTCTFNDCENVGNTEWALSQLGLKMYASPRKFFPHLEKCEGLYVAVMQKGEHSHGICPRRITRDSLERLMEKAKIYAMQDGIEKTVKKGDFKIPSSRSVLANNYDRTLYPCVELSYEDALTFLRCQTLILPPGTPTGYITVAYGGYPLGLVKNIGSRANNLHPREWRILT